MISPKRIVSDQPFNNIFKISMLIYNCISYLIQPIILIRLLYLSIQIPEYRKNWLERYSFYCFKNIKPSHIVLHAVSVGEILSTLPLIHKLQKKHPDMMITVTSMTPSGLKIAKKLQLNYRNIQCIYLPYDLPDSINRFINTIKPKLVIIMETELWPNLINTLYHQNIPCIIANARLSSYSFFKYKKIKSFSLSIMQRITFVAAQNKQEATKYLKLGLNKNQLRITGNLKFNIIVTKDTLKKITYLKHHWTKNRLTWIASSTHTGEEITLLKAHKKLITIFPDLLMIIAPRHPKRFNKVAKIIKQIGLNYTFKSNPITTFTKNTNIIINDTIGELMPLYGISDIAFIGGSLINKIGGHNPLEPAIFSIPIITGPYTFNFNDIYTKLYKLHGSIQITNTNSLINVISKLLNNKSERKYHGKQALKIFKQNQSALPNLLNIINNYLQSPKNLK